MTGTPIQTISHRSNQDNYPKRGRHLLAHYDDDRVAVYRWCDETSAQIALNDHQFNELAPGDSHAIDWLELSFWRAAAQAETAGPDARLLAVLVDRVGFEAMLAKAVHTRFLPQVYQSEKSWRQLLAESWVRVAWLRDRTASGQATDYDVLRLGLMGKSQRYFATGGWILDVQDLTPLLARQECPVERPYPLHNMDLVRRLGL